MFLFKNPRDKSRHQRLKSKDPTEPGQNKSALLTDSMVEVVRWEELMGLVEECRREYSMHRGWIPHKEDWEDAKDLYDKLGQSDGVKGRIT